MEPFPQTQNAQCHIKNQTGTKTPPYLDPNIQPMLKRGEGVAKTKEKLLSMVSYELATPQSCLDPNRDSTVKPIGDRSNLAWWLFFGKKVGLGCRIGKFWAQ